MAMLVGLNGMRLFGQTPKELPNNCAPPTPSGAPKHITFDKYAAIEPRKSVWDLSPGELDRLNAAYQALRNLTTTAPNDPRGWAQQGNVHCFNCSGGYVASNVEIHGGWWFLPWHRCYLHVHERILGKLINDPTFRLAYWDWDTYPSHAILPPPFLPTGSSLYDAYRGAIPTDVIPSDITGPAAMSIVLGTQDTKRFMGGPSDPPNDKYDPGVLERSPHGPVHIWTGWPDDPGSTEPVGCFYPNTEGGQPENQSDYGCMDMGVLATAAQDPIFFAHHSNIDRMWDVWRDMPGSKGNWTTASWLSQKFDFYDENGDWVYMTVADVLAANEQMNLRYTYQPPSAATPVAMTEAPVARRRKSTAVRAVPALDVARPATPTPVGTKPKTETVSLPQTHRSNLESFAAAGGNTTRQYVLHIDGLTLPSHEGVIVNVFVGEQDPAHATANSTSFVGTFSVVASGLHHHNIVRNAAFEIRPATAALLASQDNITVTLVPKTASGREPRRSSLTYKRIYLTVE